MPPHVHLLYSTKPGAAPDGADILFMPRLRAIAAAYPEMELAAAQPTLSSSPSPSCPSFPPTHPFPASTPKIHINLHLTPSSPHTPPPSIPSSPNLSISHGRITITDLERAIGTTAEQRAATLCYVCGPRAMTDEVVAAVRGMEGMDKGNVLCEKWW